MALLSVDFQAETLTYSTGLLNTVSKIHPGRQSFVSLICICC